MLMSSLRNSNSSRHLFLRHSRGVSSLLNHSSMHLTPTCHWEEIITSTSLSHRRTSSILRAGSIASRLSNNINSYMRTCPSHRKT
jgi:hypothetical protein